MYKVTFKISYMTLDFVFVTIEAAGRFIETALDATADKFGVIVEKYNPEPEKEEESEVESNESVSD